MTNARITAVEVESLALSVEAPEPVPLPTSFGVPVNPLTMPADWSQGVVLRTRWLSDVTRPHGSNRTERVSLTSRPSRTLEVHLQGMDRDEANALLHAAFSHAGMHGVPVPLYCDMVRVSSADGLVISGDFRFRRFFRGGRVAVMRYSAAVVKSSDEVFYATIQTVSPSSLTIDAAPRDIVEGDLVIPCIDVEAVGEATGLSHTDALWGVDMTWEEVEGANTLPGLWPSAIGDATILEPVCTVVDGRAVFPFEPDWKSGLTIDVLREKESSPQGRGSVPEVEGLPYHRFQLDLMGYNRKRTWDILRFFDAMRGRTGSFWLIHPLRPWQAYSTLVPVSGLSMAYLKPVGDVETLRRYFRRAAFFRADGSFVIREINDYTDSGDHFTVYLATALPDASFVSVQPIMACNFDSDEISEEWSTDTVVPSIRLAIVENPSPGDVDHPSLLALQHQTQYPSFLSIDGMNLILRAGAGCSREDGTPCTAWPGPAQISFWEDISDGPDRQNRQVRVRRVLEADADSILVRFPGPWENNKQHAIIEPSFSYVTQLSAETPASQRPLWSETGWTMCLCFTPDATLRSPQIDRYLARIEEAAGLRFALLCDRVSGANRSAVKVARADGTVMTADLSLDYRALKSAVYLTVRIDNAAGTCRVWLNGQQALVSPLAISGGIYRATNNYTLSSWFGGLTRGVVSGNSSVIRQAFGKVGCANLIVSYDRPLDVDELNAVHLLVSDMFRTTYNAASLY